MKMKFVYTFMVLSLCYVIFTCYRTGYTGNVSGSIGANSGPNPGCSCHGAQNNSLPVTLELDSNGVSVTRYIPGKSYNLKISGINNSTASLPKFGFQLSAVLANTNAAGSATPAGNKTCVMGGSWGNTLPTNVSNATIGNLSVINQSDMINAATGTGATGSTYEVIVPWTAPTKGSGAVVFYGLMVAANANGSDKGDLTNIAKTLFIPENGTNYGCK